MCSTCTRWKKNQHPLPVLGDKFLQTIIDLYGSITGATYTDNTLSNVENAIVFYLDYSKSEGVYTGGATSKVEITDITISGLSGTADAIYDILVNADVVGHHSDR
ncbi:hypothetical protein PC116_g17521 [Phytophthora cactorum]|nr:hypothetical protein C6341_g14642 [Phytophthora cactorum]KAG3194382.1 hypothetical protein PC128_g9394 [Phytophthora cactorum]KAG4052844.1 hypothetical protein PC123_g12001 [Phytophthora cactorum]KAG4234313.1 hypothetical protein PC116_g17521 [Phytophthora cactorum]